MLHADYTGGAATDKSGFGNDGICHGALTWQGGTIGTASGAYIEFPTSESLMFPYQQFTMLTWVRPSRDNGKGYIDFFTKGDYTAMKMQGGDTLGFFAGGWGRGECGVPVPDNWADNWHLVAASPKKCERSLKGIITSSGVPIFPRRRRTRPRRA